MSTIELSTILLKNLAVPTQTISMADAQTLYSLLKEIFLILDDGDRQLLSQFELSPSRYYALVHLGNNPGMSLSELSELMLCDKSNATRIVRGLENEGLARRRPHETDRRAIRLFLSEDGDKLRRRAIAAHERYNRGRLQSLTNGSGRALVGDLSQLKRSLNDRALRTNQE
jgi:DNA-binding MarR family transcriptional regulator